MQQISTATVTASIEWQCSASHLFRSTPPWWQTGRRANSIYSAGLGAQDAQNQEHRKQGSLPPSAKRVLTHWERSVYNEYKDDWQLGKVAGVHVQDRTGSRFRRKDSQPTEATLNIKDSLLVFEGQRFIQRVTDRVDACLCEIGSSQSLMSSFVSSKHRFLGGRFFAEAYRVILDCWGCNMPFDICQADLYVRTLLCVLSPAAC